MGNSGAGPLNCSMPVCPLEKQMMIVNYPAAIKIAEKDRHKNSEFDQSMEIDNALGKRAR